MPIGMHEASGVVIAALEVGEIEVEAARQAEQREVIRLEVVDQQCRRRRHTTKDDPQPQLRLTLGFWRLKPDDMSPSS